MKLNNNIAAIRFGNNLRAKNNNLQTFLKIINLHPQCKVLKFSTLYAILPLKKQTNIYF